MKKIVIILRGNINFDGRVQKEIDTFLLLDLDVTLLLWNGEKIFFKKEKVKIINLSRSKIKHPLGPFFTFINIVYFWFSAARIIRNNDFDYIYCNDLDTLGVMFFLPKKQYGKIIYDAHELFPEQYGKYSIQKQIWNLVEKLLINRVNKIISPEYHRAKYLKRKYDLIKTPFIINNYPTYQRVIPINIREKLSINPGKYIICYSGLLQPNREIETILESLKQLPDYIIILFIGYFSSKKYEILIQELINRFNLKERVIFYGKVSPDEIVNVIAGCDINISLYKNTDTNNFLCAPNKVFESIMAGVKIITNDYPPLKILSDYKSIKLLPKITPANITKCVMELMNEKEVFSDDEKQMFSWDSVSEKYGKIFELKT